MTSPKSTPQTAPPPPPTPDANDAAQGRQRMEEDLRKKRNSTAGSYLGGVTNAAPAGPAMAKSYLG